MRGKIETRKCRSGAVIWAPRETNATAQSQVFEQAAKKVNTEERDTQKCKKANTFTGVKMNTKLGNGKMIWRKKIEAAANLSWWWWWWW